MPDFHYLRCKFTNDLTILYHISLYLYIVAVFLASPFLRKAALFHKGRRGLIKTVGAEMSELETAGDKDNSSCDVIAERDACRHEEQSEYIQSSGIGEVQGGDIGDASDGSTNLGNTTRSSGVLWVHCASVGEFEQARPVIEGYKEQHPADKIVVTFFSPSGYELRKNYALADKVFYLPMDTVRNARRFIEAVKPTAVVFIKYEFWRNYLKILKQKGIPVYLVSGIFRDDQRFFKWWGGSFRKILTAFTHFFVQDENSCRLLNSAGFENVTLSGDTRFDRVHKIASESKEIEIVRDFVAVGTAPVIIAGSSWPADEDIISECCAKLSAAKLVVAPHEIGEKHIERLLALFEKRESVRYTDAAKNNLIQGSVQQDCITQSCSTDAADNRSVAQSCNMNAVGSIDVMQNDSAARESVLVIDTIGILSSIYKYGSIAYIGGGFGAGIHNILEAAVYGIPVVFGPKYQKFKEARDLIALGGAFSVNNSKEYCAIMERLLNDESYRMECGAICRKYVEDNLGATDKILEQMQMERT